MMKTFQTYCQHMMSDLQVLEARYEEKRYPGKKAVDSGKKLLTTVLQQTNPLEFFKTVAGMSEDLIDFAYDYDPIKASLVVNRKPSLNVRLICWQFTMTAKPISWIPILSLSWHRCAQSLARPSLTTIFPSCRSARTVYEAYMKVLQVQEAPVYSAIDEARTRTLEVLKEKPYAADKKDKYIELFVEIREESSHCNNVSRLRSYADRAEALKLRLMNEMDQLDVALAKKAAEEEERKRKEAEQRGETPPAPVTPAVPQPKAKKKKNVGIKSVALTSSWRIETEEDIDKALATLRQNLKAQLEENTIINVEF
jgi:hypothetical protein